MGLLTNILLSPFLGPIWGTKWTLDKVDRVVREELTDDTSIKEDLMKLQLALESGEIDDAEYVRREGEIMKQLRAVREWRERFGMSTSGGPVRVAESDETE
ncbi:MAG TPA: gas vesicle protein GvpG [Gemmatimonadaceae bacterium]|nr:gas vesicle protein GvpG [Gemmatimonadaceae bacterium]